MDKNSKGFTLIELLIVISIIAILSLIGLVAYTTFLKNSRDAKRQSDLKFIQSALEEYHSDQIYYPKLGSGTCPSIGDGLFRVGCALTNKTGSKTYITQIPKDPTGNPEYTYLPSPSACDNSSTTTSCTSYCLFVQLENTNLTSDASCTTLPPGFTSPKAYGATRP